MKENKRKRKYQTGDIIEVGYGITAKVLDIIDNKYMLSFSNGIRDMFTSQSVNNGTFKVEAKYTGAVKDLGNGYTLKVLKVKCGVALVCKYCRYNTEIANGTLTRQEFERCGNFNLEKGSVVPFYGVNFTVESISLTSKIHVILQFEEFGTRSVVSVGEDGIVIDKDAIEELIGNNNDTYTTKDGKIMCGTTEYPLTLETIKGVVEDYKLNRDSTFGSSVWLTISQYMQEIMKLKMLSIKKELLGFEFYYNGILVRVIAYSYDDDTKVILRTIQGYHEKLFEVSKYELENYLRRFAE